MPFTIVRQDITSMEVDAIVNAANPELKMGGGVCGAIFKAAGSDKLQAACDKLAPIRTGEAVITPAFNLPAKYIIHTAGPVYSRWDEKKGEELLKSCYSESLSLAVKNECESIAFPLISSGIYGFPKDFALRVATSAIQDFLFEHDIDVYLAVFDKESFVVSRELMGRVESYIDEHYVEEHFDKRRFAAYSEPLLTDSAPVDIRAGLDDLIGNLDEPFSVSLLKIIEAKGKTDAEVYKRANIDRKLFSKIRTGAGYMPSKRTAIALAIALELNLEETEDLLRRAGYALSHSQKFDVIVEYFITNGKYDIFEINEVLFKFDQPLLGGLT